MAITTIKLNKETKSRLDKLKLYKKESYDSVIKKMLQIINICKINPTHARLRLKELEEIRTKIKAESKERQTNTKGKKQS